MTDYVRRLVSGSKERFKDHELKLELDLVYVTDQIIIMGYPASGFEGLYRNRREDAIRFLESRHGKNYWVFNFCPLKENSYDPDIFGGRVSRYPFPDHHAPPLAIMPLFVREMDSWLKGSSERVAVLHCKAGKGRSGTMACSYLLSLNEVSQPPKLQRSYSAKQWAARRMKDVVDVLPPDEEKQPRNDASPSRPESFQKPPPPPSDAEGILNVDSGSPPPSSPPNQERSFTDALKGVLDLHTARRMKPPSEKEGKTKQGVSIPSQRRFLYYWALLLAHEAPQHLWAVKLDTRSLTAVESNDPRPKVLLTQVRLRMKETSSMKLNIVKAASLVIEKTNSAKAPVGSSSPVWASLARYDEDLVDLLEIWEAYTRDTDGNMARRRPGSEHLPRGESTEEEVLNQIFETGKWDKEKMVKNFARIGAVNKNDSGKVIDEKEEKTNIYTLRPLSEQRWKGLKHDLHQAKDHKPGHEDALDALDDNVTTVGVSGSEVNSINEETLPEDKKKKERKAENAVDIHSLERGILLDAGREVRIKLYMGQVFMGWLWFIPTFHMPQLPPKPPSSSSSSPSSSTNVTSTPALKSTLRLTRKEIDFPISLGSAIIDVEIDMEWLVDPETSPSIDPSPSTTAPPNSSTDDGIVSRPAIKTRPSKFRREI